MKKGRGSGMQGQNDPESRGPRWQHLLPEFAPLSAALVQFLFTYAERFNLSAFAYDGDASLLDRIWANVQWERGKVSNYLYPIVQAGRSGALDTRLSIRWFHTAMQAFDPLHEASSRQKFANWQTRGLLRSREFGVPDPNSAAALLLMRALSSQRRGWLPSAIDMEEPWFWVWGQQPEEEAPRMYPWPLPPDLPANTLLWSSWAGAAWLPGWKPIRQDGAIAWARTVQVHGQTLWQLSEAEMVAWDREFLAQVPRVKRENFSLPGLPTAYGNGEEAYLLTRLDALANELLFRLGEQRLYQHLAHYYSQRLPPDDRESAE